MKPVAVRIAWIGLGLILSVSHAQAATFVVNSTADPGTGTCDAAECTLREAIDEANATLAVADDIHFAIPGTGPHEILLASNLPHVLSPTTIDGYTQPGSSPNTIPADQGYNDAVLRVGVVGCAQCPRPLQVDRGPTLIRGLALWTAHAEGAGITTGPILGEMMVNDVHIEGCFLGLRTDGLLPSEPFGRYGAYVVRPTSLGGTDPAQRNVIAGYYQYGVAAFSHDVVIEGNIIGTDAAGANHDLVASGTAVAYVINGVVDRPENGRLGGPLPGQRNWLAAVDTTIVLVDCSEPGCHDGMRIQGNTFQTAPDGTPLPDLAYGGLVDVYTHPDTQVLVGGTGPGEGNLFGTSGRRGLSVQSFSIPDVPQGHGEFVGNRYLALPPPAEGMPIRLKPGTVSFNTLLPLANDPGDPDEGPNRLQNWPEIVSIGIDGDNTTITYRVDSTTAAAAYPLRIEFAQLSRDGTSGRFLYDTYAASDAQQLRTFSTALPRGQTLPFRATATGADGATSEFTPYVAGALVFADGLEDG